MARPRNAINKYTAKVEETAQRLKIDFFETLCHFATGNWKALGYDSEVYVKEGDHGATTIGYVISPEMRMRAVEIGMKYLYQQKQQIEVKGDVGITVKVVDYTQATKDVINLTPDQKKMLVDGT